MKRYLIILPSDSIITKQKIEETFPSSLRYEVVPDRVWVIGDGSLTCSDVCEKIGIGPTHGDRNTGVVMNITIANGYAVSTLWEKLRAWELHGG